MTPRMKLYLGRPELEPALETKNLGRIQYSGEREAPEITMVWPECATLAVAEWNQFPQEAGAFLMKNGRERSGEHIGEITRMFDDGQDVHDDRNA